MKIITSPHMEANNSWKFNLQFCVWHVDAKRRKRANQSTTAFTLFLSCLGRRFDIVSRTKKQSIPRLYISFCCINANSILHFIRKSQSRANIQIIPLNVSEVAFSDKTNVFLKLQLKKIAHPDKKAGLRFVLGYCLKVIYCTGKMLFTAFTYSRKSWGSYLCVLLDVRRKHLENGSKGQC